MRLRQTVVDLLFAGKPKKARDLLEESLLRWPRKRLVWSLLASVHEFSGHFSLANQVLREAEGCFPNSADIRLERIELFADADRWKEAFRLSMKLDRFLLVHRSAWGSSARRDDWIVVRAKVSGAVRGVDTEIRILARGLMERPGSKLLRMAITQAIGEAGTRAKRASPSPGKSNRQIFQKGRGG